MTKDALSSTDDEEVVNTEMDEEPDIREITQNVRIPEIKEPTGEIKIPEAVYKEPVIGEVTGTHRMQSPIFAAMVKERGWDPLKGEYSPETLKFEAEELNRLEAEEAKRKTEKDAKPERRRRRRRGTSPKTT